MSEKSEYAEGIDYSDFISNPCFLSSLGNFSLAPRKLPVPINKKRRCTHSRLSLYTEPCFKCDKYCNCDLNNDWPDVIVLSMDRKIVRLPSYFVRGSAKLQIKIGKVREQKKKEEEAKAKVGYDVSFQEQDSGFHEVEVIDLTLDDDSQDGLKKNLPGTGKGSQAEVIDLTLDDDSADLPDQEEGANILDLIEYEDNVIDLRRADNLPNYGVTAHTYSLLLKFMELHLDQIDEAVAEERRTEKFFASSLFPRPPKRPSNHFAYEEWEEELFNLDTVTFLAISQAKYDLIMFDLHYAVEKWSLLFRGRPALVGMDDFGKGYYLWGPPNDEDDSGCQDFYLKKVYNPRKRSKHAKLTAYWTKHFGFTFPRSFQWKRTRN